MTRLGAIEAEKPAACTGRGQYGSQQRRIQQQQGAELGGVEDCFFLTIGDERTAGRPEEDVERTREDGKASSVHFIRFPLTNAQAAAVTTAHATAWYGLNDLARIGSGDKVLIHSGTGGVGQAAIAIARAAGADVDPGGDVVQQHSVELAMSGLRHRQDDVSPSCRNPAQADRGLRRATGLTRAWR